MNLNCRFCNKTLKEKLIDLGMSPLSNSFLKKSMLSNDEKKFPLCVYVCHNCFLTQIPEFKKAEEIFKNYAYFSSYSNSWLQHAKRYVDMMNNRFGFNRNNLIVEIASNDGYLLQYFKKKNIPVLGIEPALNVAKVAKEKGIPTTTEFFNTKNAEKLKKHGKSADLIIGNNVLAHVPNLNDFIKGLKILLKPNGIITMEFPHLLNLIQKNQFDTIYHEHYSYFSLYTVEKIFSFHELTIFDVEKIPTHGGSLRIYVKHSNNNQILKNHNVQNVIEEEEKFGLKNISTYSNFKNNVKSVKKNLRDFFIEAKKAEKKIICYGAAAKGNTLLNYCEIGKEYIEYVVDNNIHKQGLYLPGTHIPIKNPDEIRKTKPDYLLILPWNLQEEIIEQMNYIKEWGGKFVVPIPKVTII
ncbi:MAG: methyltransferase domain-containing protein [Crenarchaeota archaeon]|nr:MAG: methyltransferase domain-containing protein [Thermoproteota archaeon]RDJ33340.1 MAG: methyltransferase domain-containing protein [Thermoproteota archaeon]RDJ36157.1 MAG: methyltransferase domain-containing protein [Thermoproteota archaeon]